MGRNKVDRNATSQKANSTKKKYKRADSKILPAYRRRCIIIKEPKHRGEWTELIFMARVAERGFTASKPWGDSSRYDVAIERNGHFLRVQVKSTIFPAYDGYVAAIRSSPCRLYTRRQVDFFAVFVIPEDVWYILPAKTMVGLRGAILLAPRRHPQKYHAYKEAWHLLKPVCRAQPGVSLAKPKSRRDTRK